MKTEVMKVLEDKFALLADQQIADAFEDEDWCELGRLVSVQIEVELAMQHTGTWQ